MYLLVYNDYNLGYNDDYNMYNGTPLGYLWDIVSAELSELSGKHPWVSIPSNNVQLGHSWFSGTWSQIFEPPKWEMVKWWEDMDAVIEHVDSITKN